MGEILVLDSAVGNTLYLSGALEDAVLVPGPGRRFQMRAHADLLGAGRLELGEVVLQSTLHVDVDAATGRDQRRVSSAVDLVCVQVGDGIDVTLTIESATPITPPASLTRVLVETMTMGRAEFTPASFAFFRRGPHS